MKNYEQMAHDVLTRRDAEIKRRRRAFLIGAPCAAAVLVGVVGIGSAVVSSNRGRHINLVTATTDSGSVADANSGATEIADTMTADDASVSSETAIDVPEIGSIEIATEDDPPIFDYTNPNSGNNDIHVLSVDKFNIAENSVELIPDEFTEYNLETLDSFYGFRFNCLSEAYPNWALSHGELGVYRHEFNDGVTAGITTYYTRNTLNYTAPDVSVSVSAQYDKFAPASTEILTADKPVKMPKPEIHNEYDENGNLIGQSISGYDPTKPGTVRPAPDEGVSTVNGYEALIYRDADGNFLADLDMQSRVRITAEGLSEEEFLNVLDRFTK